MRDLPPQRGSTEKPSRAAAASAFLANSRFGPQIPRCGRPDVPRAPKAQPLHIVHALSPLETFP